MSGCVFAFFALKRRESTVQRGMMDGEKRVREERLPVESCCGGGALSYVLAPLPLREPLHGKMAAASQVATPGQRLGHRLSHHQSASLRSTVSHRRTPLTRCSRSVEAMAKLPGAIKPRCPHAGPSHHPMISSLLHGPQY